MGKKKQKKLINKALEVMAEKQEGDVINDAADFANELFRLADRVRTCASMSQEMNELSETLDALMVQSLDLTTNELQVLQRIWY